MRRTHLLCVALLSLLAAAPATQPGYTTTRPSPDGIGKVYLGREIANVMGHQAADWLERPEREDEEKPSVLIQHLKLQPTDTVADIGCGTGYFSLRMAKLVPQGKVLGVDIQSEMLDLLKKYAAERNVTNVEPILGTIEDPKLPVGKVDLVLLVDAYHEFDHPYEMMSHIADSLTATGRVALVEYRAEDPSVPIKPHHKMTEAQAIKEMAAVGLVHQSTDESLPWQHLMFFTRPAPAPSK
ncbi:MAG TPA: class I SAM-dependent methyltransferase [Tepidisphaeraceae bacterium]|jgi:ubiquinone/menaquinone biosynthesis C-methylase UbiE|nr:class I SAM-dependent methyltransferase [Tepidisphaeraceae bacterium]